MRRWIEYNCHVHPNNSITSITTLKNRELGDSVMLEEEVREAIDTQIWKVTRHRQQSQLSY